MQGECYEGGDKETGTASTGSERAANRESCGNSRIIFRDEKGDASDYRKRNCRGGK